MPMSSAETMETTNKGHLHQPPPGGNPPPSIQRMEHRVVGAQGETMAAKGMAAHIDDAHQDHALWHLQQQQPRHSISCVVSDEQASSVTRTSSISSTVSVSCDDGLDDAWEMMFVQNGNGAQSLCSTAVHSINKDNSWRDLL